MIRDIKLGDITSPANPADIIIGMNSTLSDVTGIGLEFIRDIPVIYPIVLGSVFSFEFTPERNVHMIICHTIGEGGWANADRYVRYGLDYLWKTEEAQYTGEHGMDHLLTGSPRRYSIVQIGTGRVGKRDGADHALIRSAIAESYLPVDLYVYDPTLRQLVEQAKCPPMKAFRAYHPLHGEERIAA